MGSHHATVLSDGTVTIVMMLSVIHSSLYRATRHLLVLWTLCYAAISVILTLRIIVIPVLFYSRSYSYYPVCLTSNVITMSCRPRVIQSHFSLTYCYYNVIPVGRVRLPVLYSRYVVAAFLISVDYVIPIWCCLFCMLITVTAEFMTMFLRCVDDDGAILLFRSTTGSR